VRCLCAALQASSDHAARSPEKSGYVFNNSNCTPAREPTIFRMLPVNAVVQVRARRENDASGGERRVAIL